MKEYCIGFGYNGDRHCDHHSVVVPSSSSSSSSSGGSSVLHRIGGAAIVEAMVDIFYDKVVKDSHLMPFFDQIRLADLKRHQTHFMLLAFTNLLPNPMDDTNKADNDELHHHHHQHHHHHHNNNNNNNNNNHDHDQRQQQQQQQGVCSYLIDHHQRLFQMGLNETHFDRVAGHLVSSLHELQVQSVLIDEVVAILLPFRRAFQEGACKFGGMHQHVEFKEESWSGDCDVVLMQEEDDDDDDDDEGNDCSDDDDEEVPSTTTHVITPLANLRLQQQ